MDLIDELGCCGRPVGDITNEDFIMLFINNIQQKWKLLNSKPILNVQAA
jgi:hypothetical protein